MSKALDRVIAERKATKATGAIVGVQMIAPTVKRSYDTSKASKESKAKKAAYQRAYRANMSTAQKDNAQTRQNARRRAITAGTPYVYYPSIAQAKDHRRGADLRLEYYNGSTARIAISGIQLDIVAHSVAEREIDIALQISRRPTGIMQPWECKRIPRPLPPQGGYHRVPLKRRTVQYVDKRYLTIEQCRSKYNK